MWSLALLAAALARFSSDASLKTGCEPGDRPIAEVPAGAFASIRMSVTTVSGRCFKVQAGTHTGWVPASALTGIGEFNDRVRAALPLTAPQRPEANPGGAASNGPDLLVNASRLLSEGNPRSALQMLERQMMTGLTSYDLLVLAGMAARAADDSAAALKYLEEAQRLRPETFVGRALASVRKEVAADKSSQTLVGGRFRLRYEAGALHPDMARETLALLQTEYSRVAAELGCHTTEPIVTIVQSPKDYLAGTDAAEWSGGLFDGHRIRIPFGADRLGPRTRAALAHEVAHACLASLGDWPAWLHEGMAQKLSGVTAPAALHHRVRSLVRQGKLPRLENLSQTWSRMSAAHASDAYAYALVAVETLYAAYPSTIVSVLRNPANIQRVTSELQRLLLQ
jgi:hypothetical protein